MKNTLTMYGIWHPTKGFIGLPKGEVTYPNEKHPKRIDVEKTKIYEEKVHATVRIEQSSTLKVMGCIVKPILVTYAIKI